MDDDDDEDDLLGDAMHNILKVLQRNVEAQPSRYEKKGRGGEGDAAEAARVDCDRDNREEDVTGTEEGEARATEEEERRGCGGEGRGDVRGVLWE